MEMEDLTPDDRQVYLNLAERFDAGSPTTLYLDYYELALGTTGVMRSSFLQSEPLVQWERFLDIPEIYRYKRERLENLLNNMLKSSSIPKAFR
jgi:hypothetical protein